MEKLSRVFVALQQTVPILLDGVGPIIVRATRTQPSIECASTFSTANYVFCVPLSSFYLRHIPDGS